MNSLSSGGFERCKLILRGCSVEGVDVEGDGEVGVEVDGKYEVEEDGDLCSCGRVCTLFARRKSCMRPMGQCLQLKNDKGCQYRFEDTPSNRDSSMHTISVALLRILATGCSP